MSTYRIQLITYTSKGKTNHIDDLFITSNADQEEVSKYFADKYHPLRVSVSELETVDIPKKIPKKQEITISKKGASMYSDPEYRISRNSLPEEVKELLDDLDELDKQVYDTKAALNKHMFPYFSSGGALQRYDKDGATFRGYVKPLSLVLTKADKDE